MKILLFLTTAAFAGTLQVNQKMCGDIQSVLIDKMGNAQVATNGECSQAATPLPPPVPVPPPPACPPSTICFDKGWPVIPQAVYSMKQGQVMSFKIKTDSVVKSGRIFTMMATGDTGTRQIVISKIVGSFAPVMPICTTHGLEVANMQWYQGGTDIRKCNLPLDTELFINVKFTNCEEGKVCRYYFGNN